LQAPKAASSVGATTCKLWVSFGTQFFTNEGYCFNIISSLSPASLGVHNQCHKKAKHDYENIQHHPSSSSSSSADLEI
jgi:hypothetical protein